MNWWKLFDLLELLGFLLLLFLLLIGYYFHAPRIHSTHTHTPSSTHFPTHTLTLTIHSSTHTHTDRHWIAHNLKYFNIFPSPFLLFSSLSSSRHFCFVDENKGSLVDVAVAVVLVVICSYTCLLSPENGQIFRLTLLFTFFHFSCLYPLPPFIIVFF